MMLARAALIAVALIASSAAIAKDYCVTCARDDQGRIKRSPEAKAEFKRENPCPANGRTSGPCPGYVIDHIKPLKRGGKDESANMQWQTIDDAKLKDRWK